jgi:haloalkane dehalogenase
LSLPFDNPEGGNAVTQERHFEMLKAWKKPVHFIWGGADRIFTTEWGRQWASQYPQATFDLLPDAGHFLQESHGAKIAEIFLSRAAK